jgi:hypothetical protein
MENTNGIKMNDHDDLFIVGMNITKHEAYHKYKDKELQRAAQGIYFRTGRSAELLFNTYGFRLVSYCFQNVALSHATAWYKRPHEGRIFIGGEYPYRKAIATYAGDFRILQSITHSDFTDRRMYERVKFKDSFGEFELMCAKPGLIIIQLQDATKQNIEKHLPDSETLKIIDQLQQGYPSKSAMLTALEEIAIAANKRNEFDRLLRLFFFKKR